MSVNQAVLEKLRKVLALATQGATQGEMEAAMARAKAIAAQHNIDLASVALEDPSKKKTTLDITTDEALTLGVAFERKYHTCIFHLLDQIFGVKFITNRFKDGSRHRISKIWIIGEVTDVAIAKAVFTWLEKLFPESYRKLVNAMVLPDNAAAAHGFYRGLMAGILEANRKEEEKIQASADANKYALVVRTKMDAIAERMQQEFPSLVQNKRRNVSIDVRATNLGFQQGRQINLNQVGGAPAGTNQLQYRRTKLCDLPDAEFQLGGELDALARRAGYASGRAFVNESNLWNATLEEALNALSAQCRK